MSKGKGVVAPLHRLDEPGAEPPLRAGNARNDASHALHTGLKDACARCSLRELCVPGGIPAKDLERLDALVKLRRRIERGATLYRVGDEFRSLYAVRTGSFKTRVMRDDGGVQLTGFQLAGELLGLDGVAFERHGVDAVALEDSEVCVLPYSDLERIAREFAPLQRQLHKVMSREIVREQGVMMMLGSLTAEQRVAAFLVGLSERYRRLGYSPFEFVLRMTREEIGTYLGLKIETVSRALSKLVDAEVLRVRGKSVTIVDPQSLRERAGALPVSSAAGQERPAPPR